MSLAMCCRRSASRLASSVCGGRTISTVVNRPSLVHNPSPLLRPFVSRGRGFLYSTAAAIDDDWITSEQAVLRVIDSEYAPVVLNKKNLLETFFMGIWKDRSKGRMTLPASFPFKIEDIPGSRTLTLTREYNGEHIKVVVSMPIPKDAPTTKESNDDDAPSNESIDHDDDDDAPSNESNDEDDASSNESSDDEDDAPSNESNDEDDASSNEPSDDEDSMYTYPLVVNVTKKSGRSLELRCRVSFDEITIDDIHVNLPGQDPEVIRDLDDIVGIDHKDMKETFNEYLKIRGLNESTVFTIQRYISDKMKHEYWLWLDSVKEFLEE